MPRPNIQIDNEVREMTQEEYETYLAILGDSAPTTEATNDAE